MYRIKHVSFARSHTLASFEEAAVTRSVSRLNTTKSQERLIGGKKPSIIAHQSVLKPAIVQQYQQNFIPLSLTSSQTSVPSLASSITTLTQQQQLLQPDAISIEKLKRGAMKTQATQTEVYLNRKLSINKQHLSLSPRTIHRVSLIWFCWAWKIHFFV